MLTYAPIGYKKDPKTKNHLLIDEESRWIVERMFTMAANGDGASRICHVFYDEQIPTPAWLHFQRNGRFSYIFDGKPEDKKYDWTLSQVKKILTDEVYLGHTVRGRQTKPSYKEKKRVEQPKENWVIVRNTHEPLIPEDLFRRAQEQIDKRHRVRQDGTNQIFGGLLKCADCGWGMAYNVNRQHKTPHEYYRCRKNAEKVKQCTGHYIRYDVLYAYVLSRLQYWIDAIHQDESAIIDQLSKSNDADCATANNRVAMELRDAEQRQNKLNIAIARVYEDRLSEVITEQTFLMLLQKYQKQQGELTARIDTLTSQLAEVKNRADDIEKWIETVKQYSRPTELTSELLNSLIEKIIIHEAVKGTDGNKEQGIEIVYRFVGKLD